MNYSIIGTGIVGRTIAGLFAAASVPVGLANSRGAAAVEPIAREIGPKVVARPLKDALEADIIIVAIPFLKFKEIGAARADWAGKIVIDVTNAFTLPPEVQAAEFGGKSSSEVNASRVPGAALVKTLNQLPMKVLASPVPEGGKRVVFLASDDAPAASSVADLLDNLGLAPVNLGKLAEGGLLIQPRNALTFQNLVKFEA